MYKIVSKYCNLVLYIIIIVSFLIVKLFPFMDWHYVCLVSRLPIFTLGIVYFVHKGDLLKMLFPIIVFMTFHELAMSNELKFLISNFYSPVLIVVACIFFELCNKPQVIKVISWLGAKSLEIFIGNGLATFVLANVGGMQLTRYFYYVLLNVFWVAVFILINKILPANK